MECENCGNKITTNEAYLIKHEGYYVCKEECLLNILYDMDLYCWTTIEEED